MALTQLELRAAGLSTVHDGCLQLQAQADISSPFCALCNELLICWHQRVVHLPNHALLTTFQRQVIWPLVVYELWSSAAAVTIRLENVEGQLAS